LTERTRVFRGDRLKLIREQMGFTQDDLEERLELGNTAIYKYERGLSEPSPKALSELAAILNVTTDYLLGRSDEPNQPMSEADLSTDELALLNAFRTGRTNELLQIVAESLRHVRSDEPTVTSSKPIK
jgi:transcriptional regulator with XRE-family HTH domain